MSTLSSIDPEYRVLTCSNCLYSTRHPLGLVIGPDGLCSGCRIHREKNVLDWDARWTTLRSIVQPYRVASGKTYDCIVPVTGAQDSYFLVHLVKERLGLNPLLVTYNKYYNTPLGISNLANLRIRFDCDILVQNVNPKSVKKIVRSTLRELGSCYWPCLAGQSVFPVQTAVRYKVPLIIWGAHQGLEQVGMYSHLHDVEMTRSYRKDHDLLGHEADDLLSIFDTLSEDDIWQYRYPSDFDINRIGIRGIYLGNYVRWDSKIQHEKMIETYGFQSAKFSTTFDTYDYTDCYVYMGLHDYLKRCKHGYGKVLDHACREIRHGRMDRTRASALVDASRGEKIVFADLFCEWLGIHPGGLEFIIDQHRNSLFWEETEPRQWRFRDLSSLTEQSSLSSSATEASFLATESLSLGGVDRYITVGKGFP